MNPLPLYDDVLQFRRISPRPMHNTVGAKSSFIMEWPSDRLTDEDDIKKASESDLEGFQIFMRVHISLTFLRLN